MNKKGFTLVELLAVITVLAIIIGIGMISAISIMDRARKKTLEEMLDNLKDAAITCYIDTRNEDKCDNSKNLTDNGYFEDDKGYCYGKVSFKFKYPDDDIVAIDEVIGQCSK